MKINIYRPDKNSDEAGDSLLFWFFLGVLATYVTEGILRYGLVSVGFPYLIYLRDPIVVISIVFIFFRSLLTKRWIEPHIALVGCVLLYHFLIGLFFGATLFQALFGFKILLAFMFGIAISPIAEKNFSKLLVVMAFFFLISVLGVYVNYFLEKMPWEGIKYDTAFGKETATTRQWWAGGGLRRLPGFARTSFNAAMIIGISGFACMLMFKGVWLRLCIAIAALTAIVLTTTKGMSQTFLVITLWMLLKKTPLFFPIGRLLVVTFITLAVVLPSVVVFFDIGSSAVDVPNLLKSLWDRFSWMWPGAFDLMTKPEHYIFGKGLGSIGTAQTYSEYYLDTNAADNIFVYTFVLFGPLSLFYLSYPVWCVLRMPSRDDITVWCIGLLIICYDYGLTINMLEEPFFSILLGMVFGVVWKSMQNQNSTKSYSVNEKARSQETIPRSSQDFATARPIHTSEVKNQHI